MGSPAVTADSTLEGNARPTATSRSPTSRPITVFAGAETTPPRPSSGPTLGEAELWRVRESK